VKGNIKAYCCWFYTRKALEEVAAQLYSVGAIGNYKSDWENVYEWIEADTSSPDIEFNFSRKHDILEREIEEGEGGWGTFEVDGPVSVLLMYDGEEPADSKVEALAQQINALLQCPVYLGEIEPKGNDQNLYHVSQELEDPGYILEILNTLEPSPQPLLEMLCGAMEADMVDKISQADYGQNAEEAFAELQKNIALRTNPDKMSTSMHEAILLYRWIDGDLSQKEHVSRALACYYLLNLNEETTYDYFGDDVTVGILLQSTLALGNTYFKPLVQFIAWKILMMHEEEVRFAELEGETEERVDIESHYHCGLLMGMVMTKRAEEDISDIFSHFGRVTGHGDWVGRREALRKFLQESISWQNPGYWPRLVADALSEVEHSEKNRLQRDLYIVRTWALGLLDQG